MPVQRCTWQKSEGGVPSDLGCDNQNSPCHLTSVEDGAPHASPEIESLGLSIRISLSTVQFRKASSPMEVTELPMVASARLEHSMNAPSPMEITEFGIMT